MTTSEQRIEFVIADITKQNVDAIVNAANGRLRHGGGVAKAIRLAAGDEPFQQHCYEALEEGEVIETGQAIITESFALPCRKVIHAVGPVYGEHNGDEPSLLDRAYRSAIILAAENDLRTLAFPAISCGIFGYPLEEAARTSVEAVRCALAECPEVELVRFCFIGEEEKLAFEAAFLAAQEGNSIAGGSFTGEGFAPDTEMPAQRTAPTSRHTLDAEDYSA